MIVENVVSRGGILPNCTKIVATHNNTLLSAADHVIVLRGGQVAASGDLSSDRVFLSITRFFARSNFVVGQRSRQGVGGLG